MILIMPVFQLKREIRDRGSIGATCMGCSRGRYGCQMTLMKHRKNLRSICDVLT